MVNKKIIAFITLLIFLITGCGQGKKSAVNPPTELELYNQKKVDEKEIYLAAGCFWGTEAFMKKIPGITRVTVGYANGKTETTDYRMIHDTDHAETAHIIYDPEKTDLQTVLAYYFKIIDPTSINRQGRDEGRQYRTGIYYTDPDDLTVIQSMVQHEQKKYRAKIVVEAEPLRNYILAEESHQNYFDKNPSSLCHVNLDMANQALSADDFPDLNEKKLIKERVYKRLSKDELKKRLTPNAYAITQENKTEQPFENEYWDNYQKGIYVDITTGEPIFSSADKFDFGCGWPSFAKPIQESRINYLYDGSKGISRVEVRSKIGDAHLGYVFNDGPKELGGKHYCINSASLKFIPLNKMDQEGYGIYKKYVI